MHYFYQKYILNYETSKKIHDLGFAFVPTWYWVEIDGGTPALSYQKQIINTLSKSGVKIVEYGAPLLHDLIAILGPKFEVLFRAEDNTYLAGWHEYACSGLTPQDALGNLAVLLKQKNLL